MSEKDPIKILIVDDHSVLRSGLIMVLNALGYEVCEAGNGKEALDAMREFNPDIILMDISMPEMSGIEATEQLIAINSTAKILILTVHEDFSLLSLAMAKGAKGYILKRTTETELNTAIRTVLFGDLYIHPAMVRIAMNGTKSNEQGTEKVTNQPLTQRETEILRYIANGHTNLQIAHKLSISLKTLEFHKENINKKLGLKSRIELLEYARKNGLI